MLNNKKILILGASGFLGSHLVKSLVEKNKIIQFDIEPSSFNHPNAIFFQGSILDKGLVLKAMEGVDIVYHFAAMTDLDIVNNNPAHAIEVNIAGTTNVLDACIQENVERLIFSSSVYVYSEFGGVYKSTKEACELLIDDYDKMHSLNYTVLQLGSVYGPGAKQTNLISRLIYEALTIDQIQHFGTGAEERQYIFVKDVVNASIHVARSQYKNKKVILLGSESVRISQIMEMISSRFEKNINKIFKKEGYGIHYKTSPFQKDTDGAILYEIESPTSLKAGLKETIQSIREELSN
ncbi:MAG: NAD(P)-dependent oxidoreductase [Candidatus Marinimicrobia bacterium]|jgi:UDP-glucose 4-epimerase|nr:NAD(P)-dependent oxidoreductase [Candidatus Neomarinimicrobiota bacterium]MBT3961629.1 NAD(P)-dependent oxidoreductase [Candidatus Neomarinimicrobiota bacterium]MBT4382844.1 NAD(P)-dependent oxidoreductase [Candidatus Neomarinimicrobiota bacterium]MBT4637175.1 NAD(P)-dependent oxidoreductase [Candidatus Neomarinimicrobiota bacterium]MBT5758243.1 NAD(P)-dependent oxidoreductase [Candidatus Neomarinimicrobiota bacterium]